MLQKKHLILWEICSPNSTLTDEMQKNGFQSRRWNYEAGFDLEKPACVQQAIEAIPTQRPSKLWASLRCTPWTSIQNINQRTPQQIENLRKMRLRSRKQVRHVLKISGQLFNMIPTLTFTLNGRRVQKMAGHCKSLQILSVGYKIH